MEVVIPNVKLYYKPTHVSRVGIITPRLSVCLTLGCSFLVRSRHLLYLQETGPLCHFPDPPKSLVHRRSGLVLVLIYSHIHPSLEVTTSFVLLDSVVRRPHVGQVFCHFVNKTHFLTVDYSLIYFKSFGIVYSRFLL